MATNDDLDDFFKKKDRKGAKPKKQTGLLTNNEELLKQLVIVTSATSAFKENMEFDEEDEEDTTVNNHNRHPVIPESNGIIDSNEVHYAVANKSQSHSSTVNNKSKHATKLSVQDNNNNLNEQQTGVGGGGGGQQDEWEEFEDSKSKYDKLRLKFSRGGNEQNEDEDNDDYDEDGHHHDGNTDENVNNIVGDEEQAARNNRRREQLKDKPVWKVDQVKQAEALPTNDTTDSLAEKVVEPSASVKPAAPATSSTGAYRPPALRGNPSVTVVSTGVPHRPSKKEKPNLASTEDFPTLGAAVNKK